MSTLTAPARPAAGRSPAPPPRIAFVRAGGAALGAKQAGTLRALGTDRALERRPWTGIPRRSPCRRGINLMCHLPSGQTRTPPSAHQTG